MPDSVDEHVLELLKAYDQLLVAQSPQAAAYLEQHRGNAEFYEKAAALAKLRHEQESQRREVAEALARRKPRKRKSLGGVGIVLVLLAVSAVALISWFAFSTFYARYRANQEKTEAEAKADDEKQKRILEEKAHDLEKDARKDAETQAEIGRAKDDDRSEMRKRINQLAPTLASGLLSSDAKVQESALDFLYSYGDRLDPAQCAEVIGPLVKVLEANAGKGNKAANFAEGALERIGEAAAKSGAKPVLASLESSLGASNAAAAKVLTSKLEKLQGKFDARQPIGLTFPDEKGKPASTPERLQRADALTKADGLDRVRNGCYCKIYHLALKASKVYQFTMRRRDKALNPYLRIEDSSFREVAFDDDSAGDLNAEVFFRPKQDGNFRIIATTFGAGQVGRFDLAMASSGVNQVFSKDDTLSAGEYYKRDRNAGVQAYFKAYTVKLTAGKSYVLDMKSKDFDAFLVLELDDGGKRRWVTDDDDSGGERNAQIRFTPTVTGTYRIVATSYRLALGAFRVTVDEVPTPLTPSVPKGAKKA